MDRDKELRRERAQTFARWLARGLVSFLAFIALRVKISGTHNIPAKGPVIVIANHPSLVDPLLVGIALHREAAFMAKEELFSNNLAGKILLFLGAFPVSRGKADRGALKSSHRALDKKLALIIFPEGGRNDKGKMKRGTAGAAMIAMRSKTQILPIGVCGTEKTRGRFWFFRRPKAKIIIGEPFLLEHEENLTKRESYAICADRMMYKIAELLPKEYHGYYAKKEG